MSTSILDHTGEPFEAKSATDPAFWGPWYEMRWDGFGTDVETKQLRNPHRAYWLVDILRGALSTLVDRLTIPEIRYEKKIDGKWVAQDDNPYEAELAEPQANKTYEDIIREYVLAHFLSGNGIIGRDIATGDIVVGHRYCSYTLPRGEIVLPKVVGYEIRRLDGHMYNCPAAFTYNWRDYQQQWSDVWGASRFIACGASTELSYAAAQLGLSMVSNFPRFAGVVELPPGTKPEQRKAMEQTLRDMGRNPDHQFRFAVIEGGASNRNGESFKLHEFKGNGDRHQDISVANNEAIDRILSLIPMPRSVAGLPPKHATSVNLEEEAKQFLNNTIVPMLSTIAKSFSKVLIPKTKRRTCRFGFNKNAYPEILKQSLDRAATVSKWTDAGVALVDAFSIADVELPEREEYERPMVQLQDIPQDLQIKRMEKLVEREATLPLSGDPEKSMEDGISLDKETEHKDNTTWLKLLNP